MKYFLGLDVGTTGAKALLVDAYGKVVANATREYPMYTPRPLWTEQDPADWWQATRDSFAAVLRKTRVAAGEIGGIGLTGQMHGLVLLDKSGRVLRPCIMWNDQRTMSQCSQITDAVGWEQLLQITGNPVLPGFTAPKLLWVRENEPHIYDRIARILLPKDYIRYRLTDDFATDVADASGTSLLDVKARNWSRSLSAKLEVSADWLPRVYESPEITGEVTDSAAAATGLAIGTPVVAGAGDQAAGAVGSGTVVPGVTSLVLGTSGVVFACTPEVKIEPQGRLHAFCHAVPGAWHVMGVTLAAGGSFRWYRDVFGQEEVAAAKAQGADSYDILTAKAESVPTGSEGLLFLPYLSGERTPYADPTARGVFFGMTLRHQRPHFVRAVMEGITYSLRDCLELIDNLGLGVDQIRASGGGAASKLWRQIMADVFGKELVTLTCTEGAPYGAALLSAVGTGHFGTVEEACDATVEIATHTEPISDSVKCYEEYYALYRSLYPKLKDSFAEAATIAEKTYHE
ncbi:MAG: xylulokinase [Candidatus Neomarinimicrobiota bacterium]